MPKPPIHARTLLWETLEDGTIHILDWNLVTTSLGTMVEARTINRSSIGDTQNEDLVDSGYTSIQKMSSQDLYRLYGFVGSQWPHYRGNDPGPLD